MIYQIFGIIVAIFGIIITFAMTKLVVSFWREEADKISAVLMSWFIIMGILIFFIGIVMATGIVHSVEGIQEFKCLKYSDGTIAILDTILDTSCVNREDLYKEIEWFLDKGYTLDAIININNEGALPQYEVEVWMTR